MNTLHSAAIALLMCLAVTAQTFGQSEIGYQTVSTYSDLYDNRGFLKGKSVSIDGNFTVSNVNLAPQYVYPLHSYQVNQTPVHVTLT